MSMIRTESNQQGVLEIVLDAPKKLNSIDEAGLAELKDTLATVAEQINEGSVQAVILRGEGRAFCAGRDISQVDPLKDDVNHYLGELTAPVMDAIHGLQVPTFAVVTGACLGVGLGLAASCDVVYVAEDAKIGSPFANLGALLDSGGHHLFVTRLGRHRALDLIYTGELISGEQAVREGLFSRSLPADEVLEFTRKTAGRVARGALDSYRASKQLVFQIRDENLGFNASVAEEARLQEVLRTTDNYQEGFKSFQEKRKPEFKPTFPRERW